MISIEPLSNHAYRIYIHIYAVIMKVDHVSLVKRLNNDL